MTRPSTQEEGRSLAPLIRDYALPYRFQIQLEVSRSFCCQVLLAVPLQWRPSASGLRQNLLVYNPLSHLQAWVCAWLCREGCCQGCLLGKCPYTQKLLLLRSPRLLQVSQCDCPCCWSFLPDWWACLSIYQTGQGGRISQQGSTCCSNYICLT